MNSGQMNRLPSATVKLIGSTQVITSVSSVVKELIENSIDAGATNIEIKLENNGLDRIEVKDNGSGIREEDVPYMCRRSYTSKITDFSDLDKLKSYGFRGEALSSLCSVAKVAITTKTTSDEVARTYVFSSDGEVVSSTISHILKGTCIVVEGLFENLPVRKQFLSNGKRRNDELKRVESIIKLLSLINYKLRISLCHNKFMVWQKSGVYSIMASFVQILPPTIVKQLHEINHKTEKVDITLMVPNKESNVATTCYGNPMDAIFLFVNNRPVRDKLLEKTLQEEVFQYFGSTVPPNRHPTCLASILVPPNCLDVNLEPNKTKVIIKDLDSIIRLIKDLLNEYYVGKMDNPKLSEPFGKVSSKRKKQPEEDPEPYTKVAKPCSEEDDNFILVAEEPDILKGGEMCSSSQDISKCIESEPDQHNLNLDEESVLQHKPDVTNNHAEVTKHLENNNQEEMKESNNTPMAVSENFISEAESSDLQLAKSDCLKTTIASSFDDKDKETVENLEKSNNEISLADWSKGDIKINGKEIESTVVIGRNVANEDLIDESSLNLTGLDETQLNRSVSSQMGQKEMSAFTKFARDIRSKILKQTPGMSFTKVANELANRWRNLQEEEKAIYKEQAKIEKERNRAKKHFSTSPSYNKRKDEKVTKRKYPKIKKINISIDIIMQKLITRISKSNSNEPEIIADLREDLFIVKENDKLEVINVNRLYEAMKFHNNLIHMSIPLKILEHNITIDKEELGEDLWEILQSLETTLEEGDPNLVISDERISKNGFRIQQLEGPTGNIFQITHLPVNIAFYGINDLREILLIIKEQRTNTVKLKDCRPLSVISFIRSDTIRDFVQAEPSQQNSSYLSSIYKYWTKNIRKETNFCPHYNAVNKMIYPIQ